EPAVAQETERRRLGFGRRPSREAPASAPADVSIAPTAFEDRPQQATGREAGKAAESARARREARSQADLVAAEQSLALEALTLDELVVTGVGAAAPRAVAGRIFRLDGELWTDAGYRKRMKMVTIEPFTDAYFALLRAAPELM